MKRFFFPILIVITLIAGTTASANTQIKLAAFNAKAPKFQPPHYTMPPKMPSPVKGFPKVTKPPKFAPPPVRPPQMPNPRPRMRHG